MRAMILAAGAGKRMRPLTNTVPKPMLEINGKPLIQYHVENLVRSDIVDIVINHTATGIQIKEYLGDGKAMGANIVYSEEYDKPLETAGGIVAALPLLGKEPFITVNADIWTNFPFRQLISLCKQPTFSETGESLACIILVDNPPHNAAGDFYLDQHKVSNQHDSQLTFPRLTFSGISIFTPAFFSACTTGDVIPLAPLLRQAVATGKVVARHYRGVWRDIGTPERLERLRLDHQ